MKKTFTFLAAICAFSVSAQVNWQSYPGAPTGGFWDMDTLNGNLYVSTGIVQEYNGTSWTSMNNYNNSFNTPNKTKSCVKTINGKLYAGAKDFNTSGEGTIHYLSAGTWSLQQTTDFAYNGSYKIRSFAEFNSEIYTAGLFDVPGSSTYKNVAKWNGTDWVDVGRNFGSYPPTTEVTDLQPFQNKLYLTEGSAVYAYDGATWDSIINPAAMTPVFPNGVVNDLTVFNGELYISGTFNLSQTNFGVLLLKYNGSSLSPVAKGNNASSVLTAGTYTSIGKMGVVGNKLYFFAKKTSDQHVYLVSYDGTNFNELSKVADYGDFSFSPGQEIVMFRKIIGYNNDLVIGGTFTKVNGQTLGALAYIPSVVGLKETTEEIKFTMFPNPAKEHIIISHNLNNNPDVTILDASGRKLMSFKNVKSQEELNLHLSSGLYFCTISQNGTTLKTNKLIIQ